MLKFKTVSAAVVGATVVGLGAVAAPAEAAIIGFDPLNGANESQYTGHTEVGFTVTPTTNNFFQSQLFGNPVPSIFGGPIGSPSTGTIRVTSSSNSSFFFNGADLAAGSGANTSFSFRGLLEGSQVYNFLGFISNPVQQFLTYSNPFNSSLVDELFITLTPNAGATSYNIDNINVDAVPNPIPTPALLPGLIGMGVAALRKRKTDRLEAAEA